MKKFFNFLGITLAVSGILFSMFMWIFYPDVVSGIAPVKNPGEKAKVALRNVAKVVNKDSALVVAVNELPTEGKTLEERIAHWVSYDFKKIDSMRFKLISGIGISATDAENRVREGRSFEKKVVVQIFSKGKLSEYFLECANGLVSKRWDNMVSEQAFGKTRKISHASGTSSTKGFITILAGESLCNYFTLGDALKIAMESHLPTFLDDSLHTKVKSINQGIKASKKNRIIVLVYPGQTF